MTPTPAASAENNILSDLTVYLKYAKYIPQKKRRETWDEICNRYEDMMFKKYPQLTIEIVENMKMVRRKDILPSMRALQFAGKPIETNNSRLYNCCYCPIDDIKAFSEILFLLLGGVGVGFSVRKHHIDQLPAIKFPKGQRRYLVGDSIEGWADAIKMLMKAYFGESSLEPIFDLSDIRPKGTQLVTAGGKAPGPEPLRKCIELIKAILLNKEEGSRLTSLECHDIICHLANAVLAGGIRRSACISLFDAEDNRMLECKSGAWWEENEQRGRANNSTVLYRDEVTKEEFLHIWGKIQDSGCGEPGKFLSNDKHSGTNPSLRKGTKVLTTEGIFPIEELQDKEFYVKNLDGKISKANCWLSGKDKPLIKLKLKGGHEYFATPEHEWPIWDGSKYVKTKTPEITVGSYLPVIKEHTLFEGILGTREEGFVIGWQIGDGWISDYKTYHTPQHGWIVSNLDIESGIDKVIESYLTNLGSEAIFHSKKHYDSCKELLTNNKAVTRNLERFGGGHKSQGLPTKVWTECSEEFRKGLIDGLFSSDGHIQKGKDSRILLNTKWLKLAQDVSELLGFYGIKTSINNKTTKLPGRDKEYKSYVLNIWDKASIEHFRTLFSLSVKYKQETLDTYVFRKYMSTSDKIEVIGVEKTKLEEDVWDITVHDDTHCFQVAHCITGNCVEVRLLPHGFCNLSEINGRTIASQEDFNKRAKGAAFFGTLQAGFTDFHYLRPIWKKTAEDDALIGVGITGIASGTLDNLSLTGGAFIVREENARVAKIIGINTAARQTVVKPAGSTSLVCGSSSGIHAWHDKFYLRSIRVGKNEPLYDYFKEKLPNLVEDDLFNPAQGIVRIPQKAPNNATTRDESVFNFLERVKRFNVEWIQPGFDRGPDHNNVSATVSVKSDEWKEVGEWMWQNKDNYSGLSVLPYDGGSYRQAPFETITEEKYNELIKELVSIDLSEIIEDTDETDLRAEAACVGVEGCDVK